MEPSQTIIERNPADPGAPLGAAPAIRPSAQEPTDADRGMDLERNRIQGILAGCRAARLPQSIADKLIADKTALVEAQRHILAELDQRGGGSDHPSPTPSGDVRVGDDPFVHIRTGIEEAMAHRVAPQFFKLTDIGRNYRGMSLLDTAKVYLQGRGMRVTNLSRMEIAGCALGLEQRGGMHSSSDFPNLLAAVANKVLRMAYEEAPSTYGPITKQTTVPDFKTNNRLQLGDAPALLEVKEHGEFKRGTVSEGKETFALSTYGRMFAITRKSLVNDDTDAFSRLPVMFGRAIRRKESDLVWAQITANAAMGDTVALFHATHKNLDSSGSALSVDSLGAARSAIRLQQGLDGEMLNLTPQFLLVPTTLETDAERFVALVTARNADDVNPFSGKLTVIAEPRLDANSTTAWYLAASPSQVDIIELAFLEGENGPVVESRIGFDIDGVEIKARHDVAAKVLDFRGLYKNVGDT